VGGRVLVKRQGKASKAVSLSRVLVVSCRVVDDGEFGPQLLFLGEGGSLILISLLSAGGDFARIWAGQSIRKFLCGVLF
jgi:hypothetical protein